MKKDWGCRVLVGRAQGPLGNHSTPSIIQAKPRAKGGAHCVKYGQKYSSRRHRHRETGEVDWRGGGLLDPLAFPLTLVDVLQRTSPTEFHADPEFLQPTTV